MRRPRRYSVIAGLALAAALGDGMDRLNRSSVRAATNRARRPDSPRPGPGAQPSAFGGRGGPDDDCPARLSRRGGRRRARHRQPGGDDLRRARPDLDHREPRISPPRGRAGPRPGQGHRGYRRRRQGRPVHGLRRWPQHPLRNRRRSRRRLGRQLARYPLPPGSRRRRQGRHARRSSRPASAAAIPTSCPIRSPGGPTAGSTAGTASSTPAKVVSKNGKTYKFTCAIFRIHPKTRVFEVWCEGTSNPWGIAIDPEGSFFASACVIDHLWHLVETGYYIRQGGPYPPFTWPIESIVDHAHQKAAYCGIHYFDSPAYPPEYRGRLYMGNIHGNCINVDVLERNGSTYRGKAAPDFLRANDAWFMPVSQKTGPDGCLYILDWYDRYHCYQDANRDPAGIDRLKGRLYRVRYHETPRRVGFDLARASDDELIELAGQPQRLRPRHRPAAPDRTRLSRRSAGSWRRSFSTRRSRGRPGCTGCGPWSASGRSSRAFMPGCWHTTTRPSAPGACVRRGTSGRSTPEIRDQVAQARPATPALTCGCRSPSRRRKIAGVDPLPVLFAVRAA